MIIGDPETFAIESKITRAYKSPGKRGLGFFVIYVGGRHFGFKESDATILATAFDGVCRRIAGRGSHNSQLPLDADAMKIAVAFSHENYVGNMADVQLYGIPWPAFFRILDSNGCVWAPDGEEGFDDHSRVLQFDEGDTVRLIAFHDTAGYEVEPGSLREVRLSQEYFYAILEEWRSRFENEWLSRPKEPEDDH